MESNIKGFPNYHWDGVSVWNITKQTILKVSNRRSQNSGYCRLRQPDGKRVAISLNKIMFLSGRWDVPDNFTEVPYTRGEVFIDEMGTVYSCQTIPYGKKLKQSKKGYPLVGINYKGRNRLVELHQLMCVTFYDKDYIEKGLVCLHLDNDKSNNKLHNLRVGTYSENNKQAYRDGINTGNKDYYRK